MQSWRPREKRVALFAALAAPRPEPGSDHALNGYKTLKAIEKKFGGDRLPKGVRGVANACMAGGIAFDAFSGRKMEWEILHHLYVTTQLQNGSVSMICDRHKTAKTYGSIAKLLTPGLCEAFACYARLHRPEWCETFLAPVIEGAQTVSLPSALRAFCSRFLDERG